MNRITYAQNREDLILESFFHNQSKGFYVDVGAYDPDHDSVTKRFYKRGWSGINIEPQTQQYDKFIKLRKRDININQGVSNSPGKLKLRKYSNGGRSTFETEIMADYARDSNIETGDYEDINVKVDTLNNILTKYNVTSIDFMKIDVEGHEKRVLEGNDWKKFRPKVICIEGDHVTDDWHELMKECSYKLVFFDGLNEYYTDSQLDQSMHFDYINFVVLGLRGGIHIDDQNELDKTRKILKHYSSELDRFQAHIDGLVEQNTLLSKKVKNLENSAIYKLKGKMRAYYQKYRNR